MAVGYPVTAADINAKAGALVTNLWDALDQARRFKLWLDDATHNDAYLTGIGLGGSSSTGDIKLLRDSFSDLAGSAGLYVVAHGTFAPAGTSNYFANGKQLTGTNYTG
jgi:hypothetical protein